MNVDSVKFIGRNYHAWVHTDRPRAESSYIYDLTQNGRFKIDEYNATDPDLGADYITVHFELKHPEIMNADVFVDGNFAYDSFSDANRMRFDPASRSYRLDIPLEAGFLQLSVRGSAAKRPKSLRSGNLRRKQVRDRQRVSGIRISARTRHTSRPPDRHRPALLTLRVCLLLFESLLSHTPIC